MAGAGKAAPTVNGPTPAKMSRRLHEQGIHWWDKQLAEYEPLPKWHDLSTLWENALAKHYSLKLTRPLRYRSLRAELGELMMAGPGATGLVVNNFATVNAAFATPETASSRPGRLYAVLVADNTEHLRVLDGCVTELLAEKEVAA